MKCIFRVASICLCDHCLILTERYNIQTIFFRASLAVGCNRKLGNLAAEKCVRSMVSNGIAERRFLLIQNTLHRNNVRIFAIYLPNRRLSLQ